MNGQGLIFWLSLLLVIAIYQGFKRYNKRFRSKLWHKYLEVAIILPTEELFVGQNSYVEEEVVNYGWWPISILEISFQLPIGITYSNVENNSVSDTVVRRDIFSIAPRQKIKRKFQINCESRGRYQVEELNLMSYDMAVIQKDYTKKTMQREFYIYPQLVRTEQLNMLLKQLTGELMVQKKQVVDPFSFGSIREYTMTDSMKSINWKASAKSGEFMVNEYASSQNQKITILLDTYENFSSRDRRLHEEGIRIASTLVRKLSAQGMEVGIESNGRNPDKGEPISCWKAKGYSTKNMLQVLASMEIEDTKEILDTMTSYQLEAFFRESYVICISKNVGLVKVLERFSSDYFAIIPYEFSEPRIEKTRAKVLFWEV